MHCTGQFIIIHRRRIYQLCLPSLVLKYTSIHTHRWIDTFIHRYTDGMKRVRGRRRCTRYHNRWHLSSVHSGSASSQSANSIHPRICPVGRNGWPFVARWRFLFLFRKALFIIRIISSLFSLRLIRISHIQSLVVLYVDVCRSLVYPSLANCLSCDVRIVKSTFLSLMLTILTVQYPVIHPSFPSGVW